MQRSLTVPVLLTLVIMLSHQATRADGPTTTYTIDPGASEVLVDVGKSGVFSFAGHTHEVAAPVAGGTVVLHSDDPARSEIRIEFDAAALKVTGKGEPAEDVPEVQRTMESEEVLDVGRFARITFVSRGIRVMERTDHRLRLHVTGDLTLHGVTKSTTTEVDADVTPARVRASGTLTVKQTAFGIEPVTAGAGTVRVKDAVDVRFTFVARSTSPASGGR